MSLKSRRSMGLASTCSSVHTSSISRCSSSLVSRECTTGRPSSYTSRAARVLAKLATCCESRCHSRSSSVAVIGSSSAAAAGAVEAAAFCVTPSASAAAVTTAAAAGASVLLSDSSCSGDRADDACGSGRTMGCSTNAPSVSNRVGPMRRCVPLCSWSFLRRAQLGERARERAPPRTAAGTSHRIVTSPTRKLHRTQHLATGKKWAGPNLPAWRMDPRPLHGAPLLGMSLGLLTRHQDPMFLLVG